MQNESVELVNAVANRIEKVVVSLATSLEVPVSELLTAASTYVVWHAVGEIVLVVMCLIMSLMAYRYTKNTVWKWKENATDWNEKDTRRTARILAGIATGITFFIGGVGLFSLPANIAILAAPEIGVIKLIGGLF